MLSSAHDRSTLGSALDGSMLCSALDGLGGSTPVGSRLDARRPRELAFQLVARCPWRLRAKLAGECDCVETDTQRQRQQIQPTHTEVQTVDLAGDQAGAVRHDEAEERYEQEGLAVMQHDNNARRPRQDNSVPLGSTVLDDSAAHRSARRSTASKACRLARRSASPTPCHSAQCSTARQLSAKLCAQHSVCYSCAMQAGIDQLAWGRLSLALDDLDGSAPSCRGHQAPSRERRAADAAIERRAKRQSVVRSSERRAAEFNA